MTGSTTPLLALLPLKPFTAAMGRLDAVLDPGQRADLRLVGLRSRPGGRQTEGGNTGWTSEPPRGGGGAAALLCCLLAWNLHSHCEPR